MPHPVLFIPGPVEVDPELREIMAMPALGHRSQTTKDCIARLLPLLAAFFQTRQNAWFENVPATALMEATIRNLVHRRVLHFASGAFGERWAQISEQCGRSPTLVERPWGEPITAEFVRDTLRASTEPFEAVCITHCETSTGVLSPLREIAAAVRETSPDTLILADVVTSVGGAELRFDDWGLDAAFAGTQKCLALPPGLCVFALSDRALAKSAQVPGRGFLLDFAATPARFQKLEPPATPCVPLVFALERQLQRIAVETLPVRWARHAALRDRTLAWGAAEGYAAFAKSHRSPTVTTLCADAARIDALVAAGKRGGFTLGKGYGKLAKSTFRVGHMGDHDLVRLERLLQALSGVRT
ncbi:MAG: alanine--glyoxylate aminotransferase family protein [Planctomycetes bacterium]|nr:alanine--glyoxylate aminotransferase family protein [Planctomycetota bacterium]